MNELETIEQYVNGQLAPDARNRFETTLQTNPAVADALAFYVLTRQAAQTQAEARRQRLAEFDALRRTLPAELPAEADDRMVMPTGGQERRTLGVPMRWAAAASVLLLLGLAWSVFRLRTEPADTRPLADTYISTHFNQLSLTMGAGPAEKVDSLKLGVQLFNDQQLETAETVFADVLNRQPDNDRALEYAGIAALRRGRYDQAIDRFHRLSQRTDLVANSGTFYEALAHLKRGQPLDKAQAKTLLDAVVNQNLAGKNEAKLLLDRL